MNDEFPIIDAHAHVIPAVCGRNRFGGAGFRASGRRIARRHAVAMLPPFCADSSFPVEALLELMDREGISQAVLVQNPTLGIFNEYIAECLARFPQQFCGAIQVDPRALDAAAVIRRFASPQQHAFKLEMSYNWGWTGVYSSFHLDEPAMRPVWDAVAECGWR